MNVHAKVITMSGIIAAPQAATETDANPAQASQPEEKFLFLNRVRFKSQLVCEDYSSCEGC